MIPFTGLAAAADEPAGRHRVVHSKIIVVDLLGSHPVVMSGSHNMGVEAATQNDDNLIIVESDRDLAIACTLNVMSVFNHF